MAHSTDKKTLAKPTGAAATPEKAAVQPTLYAADELAVAARELFNTKPECVLAALRIAGKAKATRQEASDIIQKYMKKEVK